MSVATEKPTLSPTPKQIAFLAKLVSQPESAVAQAVEKTHRTDVSVMIERLIRGSSEDREQVYSALGFSTPAKKKGEVHLEHEVWTSKLRSRLTKSVHVRSRRSFARRRGERSASPSRWSFGLLMEAAQVFAVEVPLLSQIPSKQKLATRGQPSDREVAQLDTAAVEKLVRDIVAKLPPPAPPKVVVQINDVVREIEGVKHPAFEDVLMLAAMREEVLLIGPAGCGKSFLAEQVAEALGLRFSFINCSEGMSESKLDGYLIPTGNSGAFEFQTTEFLRCYEGGGVFLMDEIDAADPNVLIVLNAALANGHMAVPKRVDNPIAKRSPDFVLLAAANTFGSGADRLYVGRNQLDEATLDRFRIGQVELDYSRDLEAQLVPETNVRERFWRIRDKARDAKLRRIISTRVMVKAAKMHRAGWSLEKVTGQLLRGWSADELARVGMRADGRLA